MGDDAGVLAKGFDRVAAPPTNDDVAHLRRDAASGRVDDPGGSIGLGHAHENGQSGLGLGSVLKFVLPFSEHRPLIPRCVEGVFEISIQTTHRPPPFRLMPTTSHRAGHGTDRFKPLWWGAQAGLCLGASATKPRDLPTSAILATAKSRSSVVCAAVTLNRRRGSARETAG